MDYIKQHLGPNRVTKVIKVSKFDESYYVKTEEATTSNVYEDLDDMLGWFRKAKQTCLPSCVQSEMPLLFVLYYTLVDNMASLKTTSEDIRKCITKWTEGELLKGLETNYRKFKLSKLCELAHLEMALKKAQCDIPVLTYIAMFYKVNVVYENKEFIDGRSENRVLVINGSDVREASMNDYYRLMVRDVDLDTMLAKDLKNLAQKLKINLEKKSPLKSELKALIAEKIEGYKG
jgi:hypothetical protein